MRYIRLTVTGAATYTGPWVSISDLEVICAGNTLSVNDNDFNSNIKLYPNPFNEELHIEFSVNSIENTSKIRLVNTLGSIIQETDNISLSTTLKFTKSLSKGLYFVQVLDTNQQILYTRKVIKK